MQRRSKKGATIHSHRTNEGVLCMQTTKLWPHPNGGMYHVPRMVPPPMCHCPKGSSKQHSSTMVLQLVQAELKTVILLLLLRYISLHLNFLLIIKFIMQNSLMKIVERTNLRLGLIFKWLKGPENSGRNSPTASVLQWDPNFQTRRMGRGARLLCRQWLEDNFWQCSCLAKSGPHISLTEDHTWQGGTEFSNQN